MSWGAIGGAAVGVIGGAIANNNQGGSSSGGTPSWMKDHYKTLLLRSQNIRPQQYFPGNTFVGGLPSEQAAFDQLGQYNQGMYGPGGAFQNVMGAGNNQLTGNNFGSQMAGALSPFATGQVMSSFAKGPGKVGYYGADQFAPQFGKAGSLDATGALNSMLSGTPDYSGAQGAIDAANAPLLRQLNEEIIPGLNQKATFLSNPTGGIKSLNKVMPEIGQRMSQNALGVMEGERQRALGAQQQAAGLVSQGGLQSYGMGLNAAQQRFGTDVANAGLGAQFRNDALGLGGLGGNLAGQDSMADARWAAMFPQLAQAGRAPAQDAMNYGAYQRMLAEGQLGADMNRFNFYQQEPYNRYQWQAGILNGTGGQYNPGQPQGSNSLGMMGNALVGSQLGSSIAGMFGNPYTSVYQGGGAPMLPQPVGDVNIPFSNFQAPTVAPF